MRTCIHNFLVLAAFTAIGLGCAAVADAQIYTWHDESGHLVLSNRRPGAKAPPFAVPGSPDIRATRAAPTSRARLFDDLIVEHATRTGVRTDLVRAVMQVESGFNPNARSPKGAMGLMQLMPATARELGVANPFNPTENIRGGVTYLRQLLDRYDNDEQLALAAYNAGPGAVDRYGQTIPPYRETKDYVARIGQIAGKRAVVSGPAIYKLVEVIEGREVVRYTDRKP
ncbi:MAG: transglycosylase SLT domain-containing protein [Luteitalea sp.]|nr:transglycosylase SLT domain-containing protein [Luteitalea sp.]